MDFDPLTELIEGADEVEAARWQRKIDRVIAQAAIREAELRAEIDRLQNLRDVAAAEFACSFLEPLIGGYRP